LLDSPEVASPNPISLPPAVLVVRNQSSCEYVVGFTTAPVALTRAFAAPLKDTPTLPAGTCTPLATLRVTVPL